jgi:hypothetical protein
MLARSLFRWRCVGATTRINATARMALMPTQRFSNGSGLTATTNATNTNTNAMPNEQARKAAYRASLNEQARLARIEFERAQFQKLASKQAPKANPNKRAHVLKSKHEEKDNKWAYDDATVLIGGIVLVWGTVCGIGGAAIAEDDDNPLIQGIVFGISGVLMLGVLLNPFLWGAYMVWYTLGKIDAHGAGRKNRRW